MRMRIVLVVVVFFSFTEGSFCDDHKINNDNKDTYRKLETDVRTVFFNAGAILGIGCPNPDKIYSIYDLLDKIKDKKERKNIERLAMLALADGKNSSRHSTKESCSMKKAIVQHTYKSVEELTDNLGQQ